MTSENAGGDASDEPPVRYVREGRVGHVILNRPARLNAFTDAMLVAFHDALVELDEDDDVWVGVISGEGRAFCSGADVGERQMRPAHELGRFGGTGGWRSYLPDYFFRLTHWKPLIAATHGYVFGMGLRVAVLCEFVVAAEGTVFEVTETHRGLDATPLWAHLRARGGSGFATDVALTGRRWTAEEGHRAGVIDRLAPAGEHLDVAGRLALDLAAGPPLSVRAIVEARRGELEELELGRRLTRPRGLHLSEDFQEALRARAEKRPPTFRGR